MIETFEDGEFQVIKPTLNIKTHSIVLACNTLTSVSIMAYADHMQLAYKMGEAYPKIEFIQAFAKRVSIDRFRNWAGRLAIERNAYAVIFIDDDMQLPKDTFQKLYEASINYDILAAFNYIRGYPFKIMAYKFDLMHEKRRRLINLSENDIPKPLGSVVPCDAIGTAVCLIKTRCFIDTPTPWFLTGKHGTEDIYFCLKAKDYWPDLKIGMHTGVVTGHLLDPEIISYYTRNSLMQYYESFMNPTELMKARTENIREIVLPEVGARELYYEDIMKSV